MKINDISTDRIDYGLGRLERDDLNASPIAQLTLWLTHARQAEIKDYNAFALSTMDDDGFPSSRIVLLRDCDEQGLTFFTNYNSEKGQNIERQNKVCLNFFGPRWSGKSEFGAAQRRSPRPKAMLILQRAQGRVKSALGLRNKVKC